MSALPRPDLAPGPIRVLNDALHDLHHRAGWPSLRTLARETGVSHTTVSKAFSQPALPSWGTLELLVEAMGGDTTRFHDLWLAASTPADGTRPPATRIAGRHAELETVRRHLETGTGLLLVTGEAGIGKTTLVRAAAERAGTFVAVGQCLPLSTEVPFMPVADALSTCLGDGGGWLDESLARCPPYVAASLPQLLPHLGPVEPREPRPDGVRRLFYAVGAILRALDAVRPLAVCFEDLHWSDQSTLDLIEHLVGRPTRPSVVATMRTEGPLVVADAPDRVVRLRRGLAVPEVRLEPLDVEGVREQLEILGAPEERAAAVHAQTLGNPFFTEQLVAHGDDQLSARVAELLEARLDELPEEAWRVVRTLGVADRPLPPDVAARATELDQGALTAALRVLLARRLLSTGSHDVALRHPLIASAARARLVPGEAREVHRHLADALAAVAVAPAAEVAGHWRAASCHHEEFTWVLAAARAAAARHAGDEASTHWRRVLDLSSDGVTEPGFSEAEAWLGLVDALSRAGRDTELDHVCRRALDASGGWSDGERAEMLHRAGIHLDNGGRPQAELELFERAIELYRRGSPSRGLARALGHRANLRHRQGRAPEAAADLAEAKSVLSDLGLVHEQRWVTVFEAWWAARRGDVAGARSALRELGEPSTDDDPVMELIVGNHHTDTLLLLCAPVAEVSAAADPYLAARSSLALGAVEGAVIAYNVALARVRAGDVAEAARLVEEETSAPRPSWPMRTLAVATGVATGHEHPESLVRELYEVRPSSFPRSLLAVEEASSLLWHGKPREALDCLAVAGSIEETVPGEVGRALVLAARAVADLAAATRAGPDERRRVRALLDDLRARAAHDPFTSDNAPSDLCPAPQWKVELARLDGLDSVGDWMAAAGAWADAGRRHDVAYCRWRAAQCALRDGQGTLAGRLLTRAASDAREHVPLSRAITVTREEAR
jgi:tetratricopeptide (TPR) repeat protein